MLCVTKLCVKDGVYESCVWKRACDKVVCVCERWCVKEGVSKMVVCVCVWQSGANHQSQSRPSAASATPAMQTEGTKMCVRDGVCKRWCVKWWLIKMIVSDGVWEIVGWQRWLTKMVCGRKMCVKRRRREAGGEEKSPPYRIKNKNPTHTKMWGKTEKEKEHVAFVNCVSSLLGSRISSGEVCCNCEPWEQTWPSHGAVCWKCVEKTVLNKGLNKRSNSFGTCRQAWFFFWKKCYVFTQYNILLV